MSLKIVIFSGTTEGRVLSKSLASLNIPELSIIVSVATEYGAEEQGDTEGVRLSVGRKTEKEIENLIDGSDFVVDATHPYAEIITENIREACRQKGLRYLRLKREESPEYQGIRYFNDLNEAVSYLMETEGNILITTGAKELNTLSVLGGERLFPRVLPFETGLKSAAEAGIPSKNIIAMQGPFSRELNEALIRQLNIKYLITKDGGKTGGYPEKIEAAKNTGTEVISIRRPQDEGLSGDEMFEYLKERISEG